MRYRLVEVLDGSHILGRQGYEIQVEYDRIPGNWITLSDLGYFYGLKSARARVAELRANPHDNRGLKIAEVIE